MGGQPISPELRFHVQALGIEEEIDPGAAARRRAAWDAETERLQAAPEFEAFMSPDTEWINEPEYDRMFQELTGEAPVTTQTGYTMPGQDMPAFVNIATVGEDVIQISVRTCGEQRVSRMCLPLIEWQQLVANAARLTFPGRQPNTAAPYDGKPYPTSRDPLMQRTDPSLPDDHPDNEGYYERLARDRDYGAADDADPGSVADAGGAAAGDPLGQRAPYDPDGGQTFTADDHASDAARYLGD